MDDVGFLTAAELVAAYRRRTLSPIEVARALLDRIDRWQPALNFMSVVDPETTMAMARASEERWMRGTPLGPVDGVPATVKDLVTSRGWPTRRGSHAVSADGPWDVDAPAVARLREAGAVFLGKTTVSEYGWKGTGDCPLTGVTRNPWNTSRTPGGSSAGAAVAAAIGCGPLHIGTDGAGSIRIPAAFTGVFGLKPTFGRVPAAPAASIGSLANLGPITRTVADAALMLTVIGRAEPGFWPGAPDHGKDFRAGLEDGVAGVRIGLWPTIGGAPVDPDIAAALVGAGETFEALGARVEPIAPDIALPLEAFRVLFFGRIAVSRGEDLYGPWAEAVEPAYRDALRRHAGHSTADRHAADTVRRSLGSAIERLFATFDLLVTPQMPLAALACGADMPPGSGMQDWLEWSPFTYPFNMTMHPAASLPVGLSREGLPIAVQVVGPRFADAGVLRACHAFEAAVPPQTPPGHGPGS